jgi:hypothetical protein
MDVTDVTFESEANHAPLVLYKRCSFLSRGWYPALEKNHAFQKKVAPMFGTLGSNAVEHSADEFTETFKALQWKRLSKKASDIPSLKFPVDL